MDIAWERPVKAGDVDTVRTLLQSGTDINAKDRYGQTALMLAAHRGHAAMVELLIERGADLDVTAKFSLSALMLAVIAGHAEIARMLVRAGADRGLQGSGAPGFADKTAYDLAVARGMRELYDELRI
ncbi:MAG: ankyrin repeat domain-containing protein [Betaproteobacteria bacterium]